MEESNYIIDIINNIIGRKELSVFYFETQNPTEDNSLILRYTLEWNPNDENNNLYCIMGEQSCVEKTAKDYCKENLKRIFEKSLMTNILMGINSDCININNNKNCSFLDFIKSIKEIYNDRERF